MAQAALSTSRPLPKMPANVRGWTTHEDAYRGQNLLRTLGLLDGRAYIPA